MVGKLLTVIPLLVLSGLFFAAGIVEGGILFVVFAAVVLSAFLGAGAEDLRLTREEASEIAARTQLPGAGGAMGDRPGADAD
jgi:hypothetical protein